MAKGSFEKDLKDLEDIVARLESEEVSLEESMRLFEEGVKLARLCSEKLDKAEKKVEILSRGRNGSIKVDPFTPQES